jgi:hypothetical protein
MLSGEMPLREGSATGLETGVADVAVSRRALLLGMASLGFAACGITPARARPAHDEQRGATAGVPAQANRPDEPAPPGEQASPPTLPDETVIAGIQDTLNRQAAARAAHDKSAFVATVDQRNLTWRRIQNEVFDGERANPRGPDTYTVTRVQAKQDGYYKAWIDVTPAGARGVVWRVVWVFRPTDSGWLATEILNEELGPRQTLDTDHFRLSYYAWDDDTIDRTGQVAEQAFTKVQGALGAAPSVRSIVSVNPTYGAHSRLRGLGTLAAYLPDTKNLILVRSLECYGAGEIPATQTPEQRLLYPLTHEFTHLVNDQIVPVVKMPMWMSEGLAEYVAGAFREQEVRSALRSGSQVTLDKADEIIEWKTDPAKGYTLSQISLSYGESTFAVAYFVERFGLDTFWDLARTFGESRRWAEAFSSVTGVTWEQFQNDWLPWLRRRLGV